MKIQEYIQTVELLVTEVYFKPSPELNLPEGSHLVLLSHSMV